MEIKKKSQISIFIIFGAIILVSALLLFSTMQKPEEKALIKSENFKKLDNYFISCIENNDLEIIRDGLKYYPILLNIDFYNQEIKKINYDKSFHADFLLLYYYKELNNCLNEIPDEGIIEGENIQGDLFIDLNNNNVKFKLNIPLKIKESDESIRELNEITHTVKGIPFSQFQTDVNDINNYLEKRAEKVIAGQEVEPFEFTQFNREDLTVTKINYSDLKVNQLSQEIIIKDSQNLNSTPLFAIILNYHSPKYQEIELGYMVNSRLIFD